MGMSAQSLNTQIEQHIVDHKRQKHHYKDYFYINTFDLDYFKNRHARYPNSARLFNQAETPVTVRHPSSQKDYSFVYTSDERRQAKKLLHELY